MSKEYECKQVPIVLYIPDNAIKLEVIVTVMEDDDSIYEVTDTLKPARLAEARIDGEEWEDNNVTYTLTDEGRKYLEELRNERES